ncbi:MAG: pantoate--beta-alanine ligase, partial [Eubacterium sp.]|nr:pantoate--beta-alanine ligase [Eubacterium sp.]
LILSKTIFMGQKLAQNGLTDAKALISEMKKNIETEPLAKIDYVEAVDFDTISITDTIKGNTLVAMAVYIGKTRLIDNFIVLNE